MGWEIFKKTLGIVGMGNIGKEVIKRARGFEMTILACDPYPDREFAKRHNVKLCELRKVLMKSKIVSLHCPLTPKTENIIGEGELKLMSTDSFLINTARKKLINEGALFKALKEGWIKGAALDTFEAVSDLRSPLFELENFIASPHAGAATYESVLRMANQATKEIIRAFEGKKPLHPVKFEN
jgi:D-3-phosphoglycerate dehydrogenase